MEPFNFKKILKHLRKWLERPQNKTFFLLDNRAQIENDLKYMGYYFLMEVNVDGLSNWESMNGCYLLLQGKEEGWKNLQACFLYKAWPRRLHAARKDKKGWESVIYLWEVTLTFANAIATYHDGYAMWQGQHFIDKFHEFGDAYYSGWKNRPFEPFMVKLFALWKNIQLNYTSENVCDLGIYQRLLDHWHDDEKVIKPIMEDLCQYHWENIGIIDGVSSPFSWGPYDTFPVEILAIQRVRREQGLPTPAIDHPLMQTPLAHPPETMPEFRDDLLDQVIAKARAELPIGDPW